MRYLPSFEEFVELARHANLVPVYRQLVGDTLTPVSAFCKIQEGEWAFLFESVIGGERLQQGVADLQLTDIAPVGEGTLPYRSNFEPAAFEAAVRQCKEYIKAGDIFQ